jgi:hypothetical protein
MLLVMVTTPYTCPRCGHETPAKTKMRTHFARKNLCPGLINASLQLTDEIKQHVLANRIYVEKKQTDVMRHITIQNQQLTQINNYFGKLDLSEKVELLNIRPKQCSDKVISLIKHETSIHNKDLPGLVVEDKDVEDMVVKMCRSQEDDLSDLSVLVDAKNNHVMIYEGETWEEFDMHAGARQILMHIHENFMCEHERYLLRCRNKSHDLRERQDIKEQILKYYKLVAAFDFEPYCFNKSDDDIYDDGSRQHSCEDEFYPKFVKIKETMTVGEKRGWIKLIVSTVKMNSRMTNMMLNKKLYELSQTDDPLFKQRLLRL